MKLSVGYRTDIGRLRERNEDSLLVKDRLFAVADGMGGHRGGDVASAMTLEALDQLDVPPEGPLDALVEEIRKVNRAVLERGSEDGTLRGMGTTLTALLVEDARAHLAHVGDSRAYLLRDGAFQQLTEDHTLVQRMVREGRITPEQAEHHPQRSILTRALGVDDELAPDPLTLDIHEGDRILLCTDGLTGMLGEDEIRQVLENEPDAQRAADALVGAANRAGGDDNITVIVVDVGEQDAAGDGARQARTEVRPPVGAPAPPQGPTGQARSQVATVDGRPAEPLTEIHEPGSLDGSRPGQRERRRRRPMARVAVIVTVLAVAFIGSRIYLSHQWYVGESGGRVAIYHGIPATVFGYHLSHVAVETDLPAAQAEQLQPWRELEAGVTAESLDEARSIVAQIQQDVTRSGGR